MKAEVKEEDVKTDSSEDQKVKEVRVAKRFVSPDFRESAAPPAARSMVATPPTRPLLFTCDFGS